MAFRGKRSEKKRKEENKEKCLIMNNARCLSKTSLQNGNWEGRKSITEEPVKTSGQWLLLLVLSPRVYNQLSAHRSDQLCWRPEVMATISNRSASLRTKSSTGWLVLIFFFLRVDTMAVYGGVCNSTIFSEAWWAKYWPPLSSQQFPRRNWSPHYPQSKTPMFTSCYLDRERLCRLRWITWICDIVVFHKRYLNFLRKNYQHSHRTNHKHQVQDCFAGIFIFQQDNLF